MSKEHLNSESGSGIITALLGSRSQCTHFMKQPAFRVQMRGERKSPFPDRRVAPSQTKTAATTATALTATSRELATGGLLCFNWAKASLRSPPSPPSRRSKQRKVPHKSFHHTTPRRQPLATAENIIFKSISDNFSYIFFTLFPLL